jgi:hypothetical protein
MVKKKRRAVNPKRAHQKPKESRHTARTNDAKRHIGNFGGTDEPPLRKKEALGRLSYAG